MKKLLLDLSLLFTANAAFAATDACEKFTTAYDRTLLTVVQNYL